MPSNELKTVIDMLRAAPMTATDPLELRAGMAAATAGAPPPEGATIEAVDAGVERSRNAGAALESIQEACGDAQERVSEIARATAEQSRTSKGVADATLQTSVQIQQITEALAEHRERCGSFVCFCNGYAAGHGSLLAAQNVQPIYFNCTCCATNIWSRNQRFVGSSGLPR